MIVLASNSASRKAMLAAAGVAFRAVPAEVDERALEQEAGNRPAAEIALLLAEAKARAVDGGGDLVLGSDSLVEVGGRRFDKPASREQAAEHLQAFSGQQMDLHAAAAIARKGKVIWRHGARAQLQVRTLSGSYIESYLDAEWPAVSGCVGVFRIEGRGIQLFERIEGEHFTILGMPLLAVLSILWDWGELPA